MCGPAGCSRVGRVARMKALLCGMLCIPQTAADTVQNLRSPAGFDKPGEPDRLINRHTGQTDAGEVEPVLVLTGRRTPLLSNPLVSAERG